MSIYLLAIGFCLYLIVGFLYFVIMAKKQETPIDVLVMTNHARPIGLMIYFCVVMLFWPIAKWAILVLAYIEDWFFKPLLAYIPSFSWFVFRSRKKPSQYPSSTKVNSVGSLSKPKLPAGRVRYEHQDE